jgi:hypothetical protein
LTSVLLFLVQVNWIGHVNATPHKEGAHEHNQG